MSHESSSSVEPLPTRDPESGNVALTISIPKDLKRQFLARAKAEERSASALGRIIIRMALKAQPQE